MQQQKNSKINFEHISSLKDMACETKSGFTFSCPQTEFKYHLTTLGEIRGQMSSSRVLCAI